MLCRPAKASPCALKRCQQALVGPCSQTQSRHVAQRTIVVHGCHRGLHCPAAARSLVHKRASVSCLAAAIDESCAAEFQHSQHDGCRPDHVPSASASAHAQQGAMQGAVASGSVLGAIALITGSTVGAGILALPAVTAPAGFGPSMGVMGAVWVLLAAEALLMAEVNLSIRQQRLRDGVMGRDEIVTLRQMAEATLGPTGASAMSSVYLFLSYSLLIAYIAKGSELVGLVTGGSLSAEAGACIFTAVLGSVLYAGGTNTADMLNRGLTAGLIGLFFVIIAGGSVIADFGSLSAVSDWSAAPATIPIIFLALVYHDLIPVVVAYLGGRKGAVRAALLGGSVVPLAMFGAWDAVALSITPLQSGVSSEGGAGLIDPLTVLMASGGGMTGTAIEAFSLLAIVTSFIGTMLGLSATLESELAGYMPQQSSRNSESGDESGDADETSWTRVAAFGLALGPPLGVSINNPDAFFSVLQVAGAYGMTALYGVVPPLMAWFLRHPRPNAAQPVSRHIRPLLPGGRFALASLCACATGIEVARAVMDSGLDVGQLGEHFSRLGSHLQHNVANMPISELATVESAGELV